MPKFLLCVLLILSAAVCRGNSILIPMDDHQKNHLKAYGMAFDILQKGGTVEWLLNYRGGSFLITYSSQSESECVIRGISFELLTPSKSSAIIQEISAADVNMDLVRLEKAPHIAVYSPEKCIGI